MQTNFANPPGGLFGNLQMPMNQQQQQQQQQPAPQQTQPLTFQQTGGLFANQQQATPNQPQLGQLMYQQGLIAPVEPMQIPTITNQAKKQLEIQEANQKKKPEVDEMLQTLRKNLGEKYRMVQREFNNDLHIAKSNDQMNRDIQGLLNANLTLMNVNINHIGYVSDMLKALNDKIKSDKDSRAQYTVQSLFQVCDLNCTTLQHIEDMHSNMVVNSCSYQLHQLSNIHSKFVQQIKNHRSNYRWGELNNDTKRGDNIFSNPMFQEFPRAEKYEQLITGVFQKAGLEEQILLYNRLRRDPTITSHENTIIAQILDSLVKCSIQAQKELNVLWFQFQHYPIQRKGSEQVDKKLILHNTIRYLEEQFRQRFDYLDIYSLNRKFQQLYLGDIKNYQIQNLNGIYPSGVLLMLSRMGKNDLGKKVFDGWAQNDHPLAKEVQAYLRLADRSEFSQAETRDIYEGKLASNKIDPIMKQLYLILFSISEIEDLFEQTQFKHDKDILLWLTLKTSNIQEPFYVDEEPEQIFNRLTLDELQNHIPINQGTILELQLQRYSNALDLLQKKPDYATNYPHELSLLLLIFRDTNLITDDTFRKIEYESSPISNLVKNLFSSKTLLACVIAQMAYHQGDELIRVLAQNFVASKTYTLLFNNYKFKNQMKEEVFEGNDQYFYELQRKVIRELFIDQVPYLFRSFLQNIEKSTIKTQIPEAVNQFNKQIEDLTQFLKEVQRQQIIIAQIELCFIVNEISCLWLLCETIAYYVLNQKFSSNVRDPEITRAWKSLKYPYPRDLCHQLRLLAQSALNDQQVTQHLMSQKLFNLMRVIEMFTQIVQLVKRDQQGENDIVLNALTDMDLPKMMAELNQLKKDDIAFQMLWMIQEYLGQDMSAKEILLDITRQVKNELRPIVGKHFIDTQKPYILGIQLDLPHWINKIVDVCKQSLLLRYN